MALIPVNSSNGVTKAGTVTAGATRAAEGGRFVNTRAFKETVAGLGDRAPSYTASSAFASRVTTADRTVTAASVTA